MRLSEAPPAAWQQLFIHRAGEWTSVAVPQAVEFGYDGLSFISHEDHVAHWIEYIDKWIAAANKNYGGYDAEQQRRAEGRRRAEQEEAQRIGVLNERFKTL